MSRGHLYAIAGHPGAFGSGPPTSFVERAPIVAGGIGSFSAFDPLNFARNWPAVASLDGVIYVVNGGTAEFTAEFRRP